LRNIITDFLNTIVILKIIGYTGGYELMRYMGLDVGDRTIGVAISDALKITAQGKETIFR